MIFQSLLPAVTKRHVEKRLLTNIHPLELFRVIVNVDRYADFLPFCTQSQILPNTIHYHTASTATTNQASPLTTSSPSIPQDRFPSSYQATLTIGFPPLFTETYTSQVHIDIQHHQQQQQQPQTIYTITTTSIQSTLFESLKSRWILRPSQQQPQSQDLMNNTMPLDLQDTKNTTTGFDDTNATTSSTTSSDATVHCHVDFQVEMTVRDPLVSATLDQVLAQVAKRQVQAFTQECQKQQQVLQTTNPSITTTTKQ